MKKTIVVLLILALSIGSCFASLVQVGLSGRYTGDLANIEEYKDFTNYELGAEARVNVSAFSIAANALFGQDKAKNIDYFNSIVTLNLRAEVAFLELGIGAGFDLPIMWDKTTNDVMIMDGDELIPISKFYEVFKNSDPLVRASVGVNLGGLGVAADYKLPWSTIYKYIQNNEDAIETVKKGRVSVSVLLNFF